MNPNQQIKFDSYNDGVIEFGHYVEGYYENGDATTKDFVQKGRLYFALSSIREQDQLKYADTGLKITMKIKTPFLKIFDKGSVVKFNQELFTIGYIEPSPNKRNLFIYLTELKDELSYKVEILKLHKISPLESPKIGHFKTVWADIQTYGYKSNTSEVADKIVLPTRKKVIIRYLSSLDPGESNNLSDYRVKYKNKIYKIIGIQDVEEKSKLLELEIEVI